MLLSWTTVNQQLHLHQSEEEEWASHYDDHDDFHAYHHDPYVYA